jgi:chlorophyllide a reductase subunit Z
MWDDAAKSEFDAEVERAPVLVRISMAKRIRDAAERAARRAGEASITPERLALAILESRGA